MPRRYQAKPGLARRGSKSYRAAMSITAVVEKDTIKLPPGVHLPDGTPVRIKTNAPAVASPEPNALGWMDSFAGCIDTLPEDFAAEHDHYIHRSPKRHE